MSIEVYGWLIEPPWGPLFVRGDVDFDLDD